MKRILMAVAIILASSFAGKAHALGDKWGSERPAVWRSTRTSSSSPFTLITTGAVHLHAIIVDSPTVNQTSFVAVYNSTGGLGINVDTAAIVYTNATVEVLNFAVADDVIKLLNTQWPRENFYDINLSNGFVINKVGSASVTVLWDYLEPRMEEKMKAFVPYKP